MAVAHRDTQTNTGTGDSLVITKPTGTVENDGLVAYICIDSGEAINTPSGWTSEADIDIGGDGSGHFVVFSKVAGASEPASYTFDGWTGEHSVGAVSAYSGVNTSALVNVKGTNTGTSTTPTAPDITTTTDGCMLVAFCGTESGAPTPFTPPTDYTERSDLSSGTDSDFGAGGSHADDLQTTAGSTGTAAFTGDTSKQWGAVHLALAPAATSGLAAGTLGLMGVGI